MIHSPRLRPHHIQPNKRRLGAIAIAIAALVTSCGSDKSDDAPATTQGDTMITTPSDPGGLGVPLEPGSNLPPSDSETTPSGTTVGTELLEPAGSLVGSSGD